jgi:hypothetical protein
MQAQRATSGNEFQAANLRASIVTDSPAAAPGSCALRAP